MRARIVAAAGGRGFPSWRRQPSSSATKQLPPRRGGQNHYRDSSTTRPHRVALHGHLVESRYARPRLSTTMAWGGRPCSATSLRLYGYAYAPEAGLPRRAGAPSSALCAIQTAATDRVWPGPLGRRRYSVKPDKEPRESAGSQDGEQEDASKESQHAEGSTSSTRLLTIPNLLTVSRMVMSPFIGYWIVCGEFALATGWYRRFLAASATDVVDGFIAKRFNQKSVVGSFLDPVADKLMMTIMVSTMAYKHLLPLPLVGLILLRDVSLLAGGVIRRYRSLPKPTTISRFFSVTSVESIEIRPSVISKANTVLQVGLVFLALSANAFDFTINSLFLSGLEWTVGATTLISGLDYLNSNAMKRIKRDT